MIRYFTLEFWRDDGWLVGRIKEVPGVFSQGKNLEELKNNVIDAYHMMLDAQADDIQHPDAQLVELGVEV